LWVCHCDLDKSIRRMPISDALVKWSQSDWLHMNIFLICIMIRSVLPVTGKLVVILSNNWYQKSLSI
jgi:hypothetical protein